MHRPLLLGVVLAFTLVACGDDTGDDDDDSPDTGVRDDGGADSAARDAATSDAGGGMDGSAGDARVDAGDLDASRDGATIPDATSPGDASNASDARVTTDASGIDASGGDGGDAAANDATAPTDAAPSESFALIYSEIIATTCAAGGTCHGQATPSGNLDLSSVAAAYDELYNKDAEGPACAGGMGGGKRVVPGDDEASLLIKKLTLTDDQVCGNAMPRNADRLSGAQLARIRRWIDQGANEN
jgi:hypothetical protein